MRLIKSFPMVPDKTKRLLGQLLAQIARTPRDERLWESLYSAMRSFVWSIAYRSLSGDSELARDATQDTFFKLFRYANFSLFKTPEQFLSYLATVARHAAQDLRRKTIEIPLYPNSPAPREVTLPRSIAQDPLVFVQILHGLEEPERRLVELLSEGRTNLDIAREFSISRSAADVRIFRLRKKLRNLLTR